MLKTFTSPASPVEFEEFSKDDYSSCYSEPSDIPKIACFFDDNIAKTRQLLIPLLVRADGEVMITRNSIDLGWTRLDYVEALPQMTIVLNPMQKDDSTWDVLRDIGWGFPDTYDQTPGVLFQFCDGSSLLGEPYERDGYLDLLDRTPSSFARCTAPLERNQFLVTISDSCSRDLISSGICLKPPTDGVGKAYIAGYYDIYIYKDSPDLAALIIGGERLTEFGDVVGEETWKFKNQLFTSMLKASAKVMKARSDLLRSHPDIIDECRPIYLKLSLSLSDLIPLLDGDLYNTDEMIPLKGELEHATMLWEDLINQGCESYASG